MAAALQLMIDDVMMCSEEAIVAFVAVVTKVLAPRTVVVGAPARLSIVKIV